MIDNPVIGHVFRPRAAELAKDAKVIGDGFTHLYGVKNGLRLFGISYSCHIIKTIKTCSTPPCATCAPSWPWVRVQIHPCRCIGA